MNMRSRTLIHAAPLCLGCSMKARTRATRFRQPYCRDTRRVSRPGHGIRCTFARRAGGLGASAGSEGTSRPDRSDRLVHCSRTKGFRTVRPTPSTASDVHRKLRLVLGDRPNCRARHGIRTKHGIRCTFTCKCDLAACAKPHAVPQLPNDLSGGEHGNSPQRPSSCAAAALSELA